MSHPSNSTNKTATPANDIAKAEAAKTGQVAAKATTEVADVMSPETIVVDLNLRWFGLLDLFSILGLVALDDKKYEDPIRYSETDEENYFG